MFGGCLTAPCPLIPASRQAVHASEGPMVAVVSADQLLLVLAQQLMYTEDRFK